MLASLSDNGTLYGFCPRTETCFKISPFFLCRVSGDHWQKVPDMFLPHISTPGDRWLSRLNKLVLLGKDSGGMQQILQKRNVTNLQFLANLWVRQSCPPFPLHLHLAWQHPSTSPPFSSSTASKFAILTWAKIFILCLAALKYDCVTLSQSYRG